MEFEAPNPAEPMPTPVRGCDGCTLCCKVMGVPALAKPANTWCAHCKTGAGCGIYATRPTECRTFQCGYLLIPNLTPEWKPAISRLIIMGGAGASRINVRVDPARPDAWRRQPYYRAMKEWAVLALKAQKQIVVTVGQRSIVILPDHDVDLGVVSADEVITVVATPQPGTGPSYEAYAIRRDDEDGARIAAADGNAVRLTGAIGEGFRRGRALP